LMKAAAVIVRPPPVALIVARHGSVFRYCRARRISPSIATVTVRLSRRQVVVRPSLTPTEAPAGAGLLAVSIVTTARSSRMTFPQSAKVGKSRRLCRVAGVAASISRSAAATYQGARSSAATGWNTFAIKTIAAATC